MTFSAAKQLESIIEMTLRLTPAELVTLLRTISKERSSEIQEFIDNNMPEAPKSVPRECIHCGHTDTIKSTNSGGFTLWGSGVDFCTACDRPWD